MSITTQWTDRCLVSHLLEFVAIVLVPQITQVQKSVFTLLESLESLTRFFGLSAAQEMAETVVRSQFLKTLTFSTFLYHQACQHKICYSRNIAIGRQQAYQNEPLRSR
jgi:hypothetical protein